MSTNKIIYNTVEFLNWSQRLKLLEEEKILIQKYLIKNLNTLEAGTAGGRILLEMKHMGYASLHGFDFVESFIEEAIKKDADNKISFTVQDASNLNYVDESFDQAIYLQQIISSIEDPLKRELALKESYRILKKGGTILFSFLSFDSKKKSILSKLFFLNLLLIRFLIKNKHSIQYLPWLKHSGKINWNSLLDKGPYNYWFKIEEVHKLLETVGFSIIAIGYPKNILENEMKVSFKELQDSNCQGHIYFVCKK
jgi:ubiquinone/menaquinone biosynthesis C-methylase UbiE